MAVCPYSLKWSRSFVFFVGLTGPFQMDICGIHHSMFWFQLYFICINQHIHTHSRMIPFIQMGFRRKSTDFFFQICIPNSNLYPKSFNVLEILFLTLKDRGYNFYIIHKSITLSCASWNPSHTFCSLIISSFETDTVFIWL